MDTALVFLSIIASPITEAGKWLCRTLKREISYLSNYNENLANLQSQVSYLQTRRNDVQNQLDEGRRRLEEPEQTVLAWMRKIENLQRLEASLNQKAVDKNRCLKGLCPDFPSRRRISREALKKLNVTKELKEDEKNFQRITHVAPPPAVEVVHRDLVERLTSRDLIKKKVMNALQEESIRSIGIYGMGGIGKTTLVKTINNELQASRLFKKVIMVIVSQSPELKTIQDNIANRLGLTFQPQDSEFTRAAKLSNRLRKEEPVLVILDDLWEKLDVATMGIPCKFIITTRSKDVCIQMKIQIREEMELLPEKEAWTLFEEKAGGIVRLPDLHPIAENIVRRCKGSPLAIVTLGSSLREVESIRRWRFALKVLEDPSPGHVQGVMQEVIKSLKFSYDHVHGLYGREIQLCFLFCCLFPEDFNICLSDLRNYGIGEGFLNVNGSLQDASDQLFEYIEKLKNCSLLLDGDEPLTVKLHDVVRDVALWIAAEDENGFLVNVGKILRNWSEVEKLKVHQRISVMNVKETMKLSIEPECPQLKLRTLLLRENNDMGIDQESFFEMMKTLVVLDIRRSTYEWGVNYMLVPSSFASLTNLRTLYLDRCDLSSNVSVLGEMRKLEILCLRESKIDVLPEEIGNLTNLKCLDLSSVKLSTVATNVFSRLVKLEELYVWNEFESWNKEVASLPNLMGLEIRVRDEFFQGVSLSWNNLKYFDVGINNSYSKVNNGVEQRRSQNEKSLHIGRGNPIGHGATKSLSKRTQKLTLEYCYGFKNVGDVYEKAGFKQVKNLSIISCDEIENLISIEEEWRNGVQDSFQCLEELRMDGLKNMLSGLKDLTLRGLPELRSIWKGRKSIGSFPSFNNLENLYFDSCHVLKYCFPSSFIIAEAFENLRDLSIWDCDGMEKLVGEEEVTTSSPPTIFISKKSSAFQNLHRVIICDCKGLKKIFSLSLVRGLNQLQKLEIFNSFNLEEIFEREEEEAAFVHEDLLPRLTQLNLFSLRQLRCIYQQGTNLPLLFFGHHLKLVIVKRCPKLKRVPLDPRCASTTLEGIKASKKWFEGLVWDDQTSESLFQPFFQRIDDTDMVDEIKMVDEVEMVEELAEKVNHELHKEHDLLLSRVRCYICDGCEKSGKDCSYRCDKCNFDLHPKCALEEGTNKSIEVG